MTSKRKTSEVWTYFSVDQDTPVFAQCLLCDMRLKRGKENDRVSWSVSPLWNHLKRNHPEEHSRASDQRSAVERSTKQRKVEEAKKKEIYTLAGTPKIINLIRLLLPLWYPYYQFHFQSDSFVQIQKLETRKIEKKTKKFSKKNISWSGIRSGPVRSTGSGVPIRSGPVSKIPIRSAPSMCPLF